MFAQQHSTSVLTAAGRALLDFVFPPLCIICGRRVPPEIRLVCESCWQSLPRVADGGARDFPAGHCPSGVSEALSLWEYDERVAKVIHEAKFYGKRILCKRIGAELARTFCDFVGPENADMLVPAPLHKTRLRERGFNQSEVLAEQLSRRSGVALRTDALRRVRHTRAQSTLGTAERAQNLEGAFEVASSELVHGKRIVLVDDVLTTGATLGGCAVMLAAAGAAEVRAVTAARARR